MTRPTSVWTAGGAQLTLGGNLGLGGRGQVFAVHEDPRVAVKRYRRADPAHAERIGELLAHPARSWVDGRGRHLKLAWPLGVVNDEQGVCVGYAMVRLGHPRYVPLTAVLSAERRRDAGLDLWWPDLLAIAASLAGCLAEVHAKGLTFGDLSRPNVLVAPADRVAVLIDCDGVRPERSLSEDDVFSAETSAPELLTRKWRARSRESDLWALSVLVCQLLMEGEHPFTGTPVDEADDIPHTASSNVLTGRSRFAPAGLRLPRDLVPLDVLPSRVHDLAADCFTDGARQPLLRPSATRWATALDAALGDVRSCPDRDCPRHRYTGDKGCPWCAMVAAGHPDPYPGPTTRRRERMRTFRVPFRGRRERNRDQARETEGRRA